MPTAQTQTDGEALFRSVVSAHTADPGITQSKMFGSPGLKTGGKVFACLWKGSLVLKLPAPRVEALLERGAAVRFDPGMGRQMKEWVEVPPSTAREWLALAAESRAFVESLR
jgi:hypothetical protein